MNKALNRLSIAAICPDTLDDFRRLLSVPPEGWCWCVAWEVPTWEGWGERSSDQNRTLRERLWAEKQFYGYLFLMNDQPVGWCRVGPTKAWPKLVTMRSVESRDDLYAFTCFGMNPKLRNRGLLHRYLPMVIKDLTANGVREFVAFPKPSVTDSVDAGQLWNGPATVFLKAGFRVVRETPQYIEMRLSLRLGSQR